MRRSPEILAVVDRLAVITAGYASVTDLPSLAETVEAAMSGLLVTLTGRNAEDARNYTALYLWDYDESRLRLFFALGFTESERAEAEATAWERHPGEVFRSQQELHVPDVDAFGSPPTVDSARSFRIRSRLYVPVVFRGESLGVFGLASPQTHSFQDEHIAVLRFVSRLTAVVYGQLLDSAARKRAQAERQRAQADLATTAERLHLLIRSLPIALVGIGPDGMVTLAEGAALANVVTSPADPVGQPVREVFAPEIACWASAALTGNVERLLYRAGPRTLEIGAERSAAGVTLLFHNVTEHQQALERLQQLNEELARARDQALSATRAKSQFLTTMSHELRTPLNAVIGYAELMVEEMAANGGTSYDDELQRIIRSARELLQLINDILDLSKIEAGRFELTRERVDVVAVLRSVEAALRPLRDKNDNRMHVSCAPELAPIDADSTALRRILLNLVGNANKFTHHGRIEVRAWEEDRPDGSRLHLTVSDTGIGMDEQALSRVFEAFTQADSSTSRRYGGTGLGLTITQQLVHLMGGDIAVTSRPQSGSTFHVWIPTGRPGSAVGSVG